MNWNELEWIALAFSIFVIAVGFALWLIMNWLDRRTARLLKEAGGT